MMRFATACSGIGAPEVAWGGGPYSEAALRWGMRGDDVVLGWDPVFQMEVEAFPSAVLSARFPGVPNLGDMTGVGKRELRKYRGAVDVFCAGTPCQSFSVAGKRAGLDDARGILVFDYLRIAHAIRSKWVVWENVAGVLSDRGGHSFATILGAFWQCGYRDLSWRVFDAQYAGVGQRRRRVFVVGCLGEGMRSAAVLFERAGLRGDSAPCGEAGEGVAGTLAARTRGGDGLGTDLELDGGLVAHALRGEGFDGSEDGSGRGTPLVVDGGKDEKDIRDVKDGEETTGRGRGGGSVGRPATAARVGVGVRRLTPRECERLQGFPDDFTLIDYRGKPAKDGPRYRAVGNSKAVPVVRWIGRRIEMVEGLR